MILYFDDNDAVNLHNVSQIKNVRSLDEALLRYSNSKFEFRYTKNYTVPGLYPVEVSKHSHLWIDQYYDNPDSFNLLKTLPMHVIKAVNQHKIRIAIISIVEGDDFVKEDFDGFASLHKTINDLKLPKLSVIIVSGNLNCADQYADWCVKNKTSPVIEFTHGIEWDGKPWKAHQICKPLAFTALTNATAKSFNSLNRAHRPHRTDHLYMLCNIANFQDIYVSGGSYFEDNELKPKYINVDNNSFTTKLQSQYPRSVDIGSSTMRDNNPAHSLNTKIYENSLLTVITESSYEGNGCFITEKTFRSIAAGHPFIILGQPNFVKKLKSFGFEADFKGLDLRYDNILSAENRFVEFHNTLKHWHNLPRKHKNSLINNVWKDQIQHNFDLYRKVNFKKIMFDELISSTEEYFRLTAL
jgi:hypothetical protein